MRGFRSGPAGRRLSMQTVTGSARSSSKRSTWGAVAALPRWPPRPVPGPRGRQTSGTPLHAARRFPPTATSVVPGSSLSSHSTSPTCSRSGCGGSPCNGRPDRPPKVLPSAWRFCERAVVDHVPVPGWLGDALLYEVPELQPRVASRRRVARRHAALTKSLPSLPAMRTTRPRHPRDRGQSACGNFNSWYSSMRALGAPPACARHMRRSRARHS